MKYKYRLEIKNHCRIVRVGYYRETSNFIYLCPVPAGQREGDRVAKVTNWDIHYDDFLEAKDAGLRLIAKRIQNHRDSIKELEKQWDDIARMTIDKAL